MRRNKILVNLILLVFSLGFLGLSAPRKVVAASASLYLTPGSGTYVIGGQFNVSVKVNSGGDEINAAEGRISYDADLIEAVSISKGGTIFPFWTTEPSISGATISFGGGMPPPAYSGTAGHICTITFKAKKVGTATVRFTSGAVLANDGKGTNVLSSMGSASYVVSPKVEAPKTDTTSTKIETKVEETKVVIEPEYNKPVIKSSTHSDSNVWYKESTAKFNWELPTGVTGVSILLDENPVSDPGPASDGEFNEKTYEELEDGVHYLHLKFKDSKKWGTVAHFRIMIDSTPPEPFEVNVRRIGVGEWPELLFEATDKDSGMEKYEIFIGSLEKQSHELEAQSTQLKLEDLSVGEHTALVKALDKAGNERVVTVHFIIDPIESPVILNYPREMKSSDKFYVNGTAIVDSKIIVNIFKGMEQISAKEIRSDAQGNWFYVHEDNLDNDRYTVNVVAENKNGIKSNPSQTINFLVSPPVFAVIGSFVVDYFTVFVSLIFLIVLIILIILYIIGFIRKRLKKETIEIEEVLSKNAKLMKEIIEAEFVELAKHEKKAGYQKEKEKMKERLLDTVDANVKKSMKEVRDVEDILK